MHPFYVFIDKLHGLYVHAVLCQKRIYCCCNSLGCLAAGKKQRKFLDRSEQKQFIEAYKNFMKPMKIIKPMKSKIKIE